jgi:hypothetical protein
MEGLSKEFIDAVPAVKFDWDNYTLLYKMLKNISEDEIMKYTEALSGLEKLHSKHDDTKTILANMNKDWNFSPKPSFNQLKEINIESRLLCLEVGEFDDDYEMLLQIQGCTSKLMKLELQGEKDADEVEHWIGKLMACCKK